MRGQTADAKGVLLKFIPSFQYINNSWCIHVQEITLLKYYFDKYKIDYTVTDDAKKIWDKYKFWTNEIRTLAKKKNSTRDFSRIDNIPKVPKGQLLPFQTIGAIAAKIALMNCGGFVIGDPVGLGKTPQSIAVAESLMSEGEIDNVIVLCKSTSKYNWEAEIEKFTDRKSILIEGDKNNRTQLWNEARQYTGIYILMNYDQLIRDEDVFNYAWVNQVLVIYDEIQMLKNKRAQRSKKALHLSRNVRFVLGLSASFYEITILDIFGIWSHIDTNVFGEHVGRFIFHFVVANFWGGYLEDKKRKLAKSKIKPYFIRRLKENVQEQLPNILYIDHKIELHPDQYRLYKEIKSEILDNIELNPLTVFGKLLRCINCPRSLVEGKDIRNAKIDDILEFMDGLEPKDRVVIFSHFIDPAEELLEKLAANKIKALGIVGQSIKPKVRFKLLTEFNADNKYKVLVTTDVLRESHNIPSANYLINYDIPFNPQHLVQRVGRIDRMTNKHAQLFVVNLFSKNTIEEKIYKKMYARLNDGTDIMDDMNVEKRITRQNLLEML